MEYFSAPRPEAPQRRVSRADRPRATGARPDRHRSTRTRPSPHGSGSAPRPCGTTCRTSSPSSRSSTAQQAIIRARGAAGLGVQGERSDWHSARRFRQPRMTVSRNGSFDVPVRPGRLPRNDALDHRVEPEGTSRPSLAAAVVVMAFGVVAAARRQGRRAPGVRAAHGGGPDRGARALGRGGRAARSRSRWSRTCSAGVAWADKIRSESAPGVSSIEIIFEPGTNLYRARQVVQERISQAAGLPQRVAAAADAAAARRRPAGP